MPAAANRLVNMAVDQFRELGRRFIDTKSDEAFTEAAHICLRVVSDEIDALHARMNSGNFLSEAEQLVLARITELRSEIERQLQLPDDNSADRSIHNRLSGDGR